MLVQFHISLFVLLVSLKSINSDLCVCNDSKWLVTCVCDCVG